MCYFKARATGVLLVVVLWASLGRVAVPDARKPKVDPPERHAWQAIAYPPLPCRWATKSFIPLLCTPGEDETQGLKLRIEFHGPGIGEVRKDDFIEPEAESIESRLHFADGSIIMPKEKDDFDLVWFGGVGTVVVKVGETEAKTVVPSSLFNYVHGVADPYHKANFRP